MTTGVRDYFTKRAPRLIPFLVAAVVYLILRSTTLGGLVPPPQPGSAGWSRLAVNLYTIPVYVRKFIFPEGLSAYYSAPDNFFHMTWLYVAWAGIFLGSYRLFRKGNAAIKFGMVWFVFEMIPVSHIVPISSAVMADRYMYLPMIGLSIMTGAGWEYLMPAYRTARTWTFHGIILGCLLCVLATITVMRNMDWKNDETLFSRVLATDPRSVFALYNLANFARAQNVDKARELYLRVLEQEPAHSRALNQLGNIALLRKRPAEARDFYLKALEADPNNSEAHYNMALACEAAGDMDSAVTHYQRFLSRVPPEYKSIVPEVTLRIEALRRRAGIPLLQP